MIAAVYRELRRRHTESALLPLLQSGDEGGRAGLVPAHEIVPNDETCFHVFDSADEKAVGEVCRRAGIGSARIVPALE